MRNNNTVGGILWNWILVISYNGLSHSVVWMWRYNDHFAVSSPRSSAARQLGSSAAQNIPLIFPTSFFLYHSLSPLPPPSPSSPALFLPFDIVYVLMLIMTVVMTASLALTCTQPLQLSWWFTASSSHREREREAHYSCLWGELYVHCKLATQVPPQRPSHRADRQ